MKVMRATELWQRTGAYYVRIQAMGRQHGISLDEEFDEHDNDECKYIVILDGDFPVATCRLFSEDGGNMKIGRVVVLEEYRGRGLGRKVVTEAEKWIKELGTDKVLIDSRDVATGFYEKLGYHETGDDPEKVGTFMCVHMEKTL